MSLLSCKPSSILHKVSHVRDKPQNGEVGQHNWYSQECCVPSTEKKNLRYHFMLEDVLCHKVLNYLLFSSQKKFNCFYLYLLLLWEIIGPIGNLEKSKPPDGNWTHNPLWSESSVAQWLECPTRSRRVMGLIPIWGLGLFQVPNGSNRSFYSFLLSCLAFEWKWGWRWPCFDRNLPAFLMLMMLFSC